MKPSEVYRRAAELIASGVCSDVITAITKASGHYAIIAMFDGYFLFSDSSGYGYFLFSDNSGFGAFTPENQRARELALYLMAEIAEDWE